MELHQSHSFVLADDQSRWFCSNCGCTRMFGVRPTLATSKCLKITKALRSILECRGEHGHVLWVSPTTTGNLVWCACCHGYSSGGKSAKLGNRCIASSSTRGFGPATGKRLRRGVHPQGHSTTGRAYKVTEEIAKWFLERVEDSTSVGVHASVNHVSVGNARALIHTPSSADQLEGYSSEDDPMGWGFDMGFVQ